jgi:hypothetical protein
MKKKPGIIAAVLFCAMFGGGVAAPPAVAQDKKAESSVRAQKVLIDNERVRVTESVFKPGEANPVDKRGPRVTRILKGSTSIQRTHADGKVEMVEWKEGATLWNPGDHASSKNVGTSEVTIVTITLK